MKKLLIEKLPELSNSIKESLRTLRTNIQFCGSDYRTLLLTSVTPDEGKSTVSFEIARSLAETNKKVLFIDTDIRKSVLVRRYDIKVEDGSKLVGLSHYLSGQVTAADVLYSTTVNNLFAIFSGPSVPNVTEILDNSRFSQLIQAVRDKFDYVIVDTSPITAAIDSSLVAKHCDGAVVIIVPEENNTRLINHCIKQLSASGIKILGVVLNKVKYKKNDYYGRYYGSYYGKYYGKYYGHSGKE